MMVDTNQIGTEVELDPLLRPLDPGTAALLQVVGDAVLATGAWPVYQYVQAKVDERGYDIVDALAAQPSFSHLQLTYPLARADRGGGEDKPVKLTIAGIARLDGFAATIGMFLRVLRALAQRRAVAPYEPGKVITVEVSGPQLVAELQLQDEQLVGLLPELLQGEPVTWAGHNSDANGWVHRPGSHVRRFADVRDVDDYIGRLRAWVMPAAPVPVPQPASPLSVVNALDHLDVVWRLHFGRQLAYPPSFERAARLTFDVSTADEFNDRLSALGEALKGLDVPGSGGGPLDRMRRVLTSALPAEALPGVRAAIDTLRQVTHVRNGGQHVGAATDAAAALPALGVAYPILDYPAAWWTVQARVVNALDTIRTEIRAALPPAPRPVENAPRRGQTGIRRPRPDSPRGGR